MRYGDIPGKRISLDSKAGRMQMFLRLKPKVLGIIRLRACEIGAARVQGEPGAGRKAE
jgi:hypothetical protein